MQVIICEFAYCYYLTSITFVEGLISIDEMAFRTCGFTSITLPKSLTSIGSSAFSYCNSLTTVYYNGAIDGGYLGADEFIPGDVNGDGRVNMFDYAALKKLVMEK